MSNERGITPWSNGPCPEDNGWVINGVSWTQFDVNAFESHGEAADAGIPGNVLDAFEVGAGGDYSPSYGMALSLWLSEC